MLARLVSFVRAWLLRGRVEREMAIEWQFHLDERVQSLVTQDVPRDEAVRRAHLEFGDPLRWREQGREARGLRPIQDLGADVRYALRQIGRAPAFSAVVVTTLALAIGTNTAIFSVVNGLLLRPLPVEEPEHLVLLSSVSKVTQRSSSASTWPYQVWEHIRDQAPFDAALAWSNFGTGQRRFDLGSGGAIDPVDGLFVSGGFFDALGVRALLGRTFIAADMQAGQAPVAVIGYGLWQRRFGGADDVIGTSVLVERVPVTIVGVLPPGFFGVEVGRSFDVALPIAAAPAVLREPEWLTALGRAEVSMMFRLRPGQSVESATALLRGMQAQVVDAIVPPSCPECRERILADPFTLVRAGAGASELRGQYRQPLVTVLGIAMLVLLVACANVANLMVARGTSRRHEMGVRLALGAPRWRLARQTLVESVLLAALGAGAGMLLARWAGAVLVGQLATLDSRVVLDLPLDLRVMGFAMVMTFATAVLFGAAPALRASRAAPARTLSGSAAGASSPHAARWAPGHGLGEGGLVIQVALSLVLVAAAALFIRSFERLMARPLGFDADRVLVVTVNAAHSSVPAPGRLDLYQELVGIAAAVPGVTRTAASALTPVSATSVMAHLLEGGDTAPIEDRIVPSNYVTPGWFDVYGSPLLAGRDIEAGDSASRERVVVVNQAFVERFLPADIEPLGQIVRFSTTPAGPRRIVGIVGNAIVASPAEPLIPAVYEPLAQWAPEEGLPSRIRISIRSAAGSPTDLAPAVLSALTARHPDLSFSVQSLSGQVEASVARNRLLAWLSGFFGVLALLLAAVGLYGLTAYAAARRRREMGIRLALGATRQRVVRIMLSRMMRLVVVGLVLGLVACSWLSRFVEGLIYGIEPRDVATLATATLVLIAVGALAAWLPAYRVSRADPWAVLREL